MPIDLINEPPHYKAHPSGVEAIEITSQMMFCAGNAIKYLFRAGHKGSRVEDLKKAAWYLRREADRLEQSEEWRPSALAPGYAISSLGRVWRWGSNKPLSQYPNSAGYLKVQASLASGVKNLRVHKLVAHAFLGPRPENLVTAHCDGNKRNNAINNLRYCTHAENEADKKMHGTLPAGERSNMNTLTACQVTEIRARRTESYKTLAQEFKVHPSTIHAVWAGRTWKEPEVSCIQRVINTDTGVLGSVLILMTHDSANCVANLREAARIVEATAIKELQKLC